MHICVFAFQLLEFDLTILEETETSVLFLGHFAVCEYLVWYNDNYFKIDKGFWAGSLVHCKWFGSAEIEFKNKLLKSKPMRDLRTFFVVAAAV